LQRAELLDPAAVGLTRAEYDRICATLERSPNSLELAMFGVLWSEHCSYKHSKSLLRRFPTSAPHVIQGPGENAGAVDIGDGLAAIMKIESHNHPSAVEPFQGAATGVGGILRDIFTMGGRPIALMDALSFGDPEHGRVRYLLGGVVGGIALYGNCVGVPTVGGSVTFHPSYTGNPLVNVLCLGVANRDRILRSGARGLGNSVLLVGSATGRDGIAGASFASAELSGDTEERRPAVQVGNPFLEKLLIEACLELVGDSDVVAMQDLGAAGLTGAATEMAASGGSGIDLDVRLVSRREAGMTPMEVMLSESQERMLVVVRAGAELRIQEVFRRWELHSDVIGQITDDGIVRVRDGASVVAELPATFLSGGAPIFVPPGAAPNGANGPEKAPAEPPFRVPEDFSSALIALLMSPNLCSRRSIFEQYDHMVQTNTVVAPGQGAAVLRIKGTSKALVLGLGSNPRACAAAPAIGGAMAVAEACRNVACAGARPLAITDCLNFGDPERPAVWQAMTDVVEGMRAACVALDVPVISGNVSLYNETDGAPIAPTPMVGALGLIEDVHRHARSVLQEGQELWLLGPLEAGLGASEYAAVCHGWNGGTPVALDLDLERRVQACVQALVADGTVPTATDVAEGGLAVALAELAMTGGVGLVGSNDLKEALNSGRLGRPDQVLFGEAASRVIVGAAADAAEHLESVAREWNVSVRRLGVATGSRLEIGGRIAVPVEELRQRWETALDRLMGG
jgi:phosphoribosylformylglycinamidine synthase